MVVARSSGGNTRAHAGTFSPKAGPTQARFHSRAPLVNGTGPWADVRGPRVCTRPDDSQPLSASHLFPWMNLHRVRRASSLRMSVRFSTFVRYCLLHLDPDDRTSRFFRSLSSSPCFLLVYVVYRCIPSKFSWITRGRDFIWPVKFDRLGWYHKLNYSRVNLADSWITGNYDTTNRGVTFGVAWHDEIV